MRILFVSTANLQEIANSGVIKKVKGQAAGLRKIGENVDFVILDGDKIASFEKDGQITRIMLPGRTIRYKVNFVLEKILNKGLRYDLLYLRLPGMSLKLLHTLRKYRNNGLVVMIEVYTYPLIKERLESARLKATSCIPAAIKEYLSTVIDGFLYNFLRFCTDYIVTFSPDKVIWGIPTISICNGIDFDNEKPLPYAKNTTNEIHLITVANISYWHGYDRLIRGMANYYKKGNSKYNLFFHIVGDGPERNNLQTMVHDLNIEDYVLFHGIKVGHDLEQIYLNKDIGVASLAMHRKNIKYTSELKIREYFAKGLPFIIGTTDPSVDYKTAGRFYLSFTPDDSAIDVHRIIEFWKRINRDDTLRGDMRAYGLDHYDWKVQMSQILNRINRD